MAIINNCLTFNHKYYSNGKMLETRVNANAYNPSAEGIVNPNNIFVFLFPNSPVFEKAEVRSEPTEVVTARGYSFPLLTRDTQINLYENLQDPTKGAFNFLYHDGKLLMAEGHVRGIGRIYPHRGFNFAVELIHAIGISKNLPIDFRKNLGRVARITSLDDYMSSLESDLKKSDNHLTTEQYFNQSYLLNHGRLEYLPMTNVRN